MKKKIITTIIIVVILLIIMPIPVRLKDGGSVEYKSLIYKVTKFHKLTLENEENVYNDGIKIEIFGITIFNNFKEKESQNNKIELTEDFEIKTIKEIGCKNETELYYESKNKKIYTICLNSIEIKDKNKVYPLKELLKSTDNIDEIINKITSKLEFVLSYDDGGSSIYKSNNLSILKCKTLEGNNNIYIGNDLINLDSKYCIKGEN